MTRTEISIGRLEETAAYFRHMREAGYDGDADIYKKHEDSCLAAIEILKEYNEEDREKAD